MENNKQVKRVVTDGRVGKNKKLQLFVFTFICLIGCNLL
jgi:hypothetical protein